MKDSKTGEASRKETREDIIARGEAKGLYRCTDSDVQLLEVDELGGHHWSVNIPKKDKSQDHSSLYT
jgi:hypothetical protein